MVIISGTITLHPGQREAFLMASRTAIEAARQVEGCNWFVVSADPIDPDIANVYEEWASEAELQSFRNEGPSEDMQRLIATANVQRHFVAKSAPA
ncbi:antibiotic biosynthesis monooxygenase [Devosia rhodophyticola]|uniref:Antibiotic biosynthesis monooxygenase n=1 Tax=Devosia rhodophyticola TaxID=3026423 RepID=A0ABY7YZS4_9HYPH|nr:antibiotic biosynthesis monooxygenase [Devosia rhodophyticola]WDR06757.1 antibiotic biosynthesis monooxygenase [Devosia rhodophyticola]